VLAACFVNTLFIYIVHKNISHNFKRHNSMKLNNEHVINNKETITYFILTKQSILTYSCLLIHYIIIFSAQPSTRIFQPVPENSIIKGTKDVPLELKCLSTGGYPQPTVTWFKYRSGQRLLRITQCTTSSVLNQNMYDVTEKCTFTPTQADDGAILYCESSYTGELTLRAKSDEIQLQLLCK